MEIRRIYKLFPVFSDGNGKLKFLKIITIISPAIFILLLEMSRPLMHEELPPIIAQALPVFLVVVLAAFFYWFVFDTIESKQQENIRRNRELGIINEMALTVNESLDLNVMLSHTMEKLIQVTKADSGDLFLMNEKSRELSYVMHVGIFVETSKLESSTLTGDGLVGEVARSYKPIIIQNLKTSGRALNTNIPIAGFGSLAAIPLKTKSGVVGVFALFSLTSGHFKSSDVGLLTDISKQIAVAIENARRFEKVQAMTIIEERERIAKELHDGLAQVLGYVITKSQATRQILQKMVVATDYLVELENVAHELYTDTREDILGLRTAISGDRDMISALRDYLARFSQMYGIRVTLDVDDQVIPPLSPQVELQAMRIAQEALSNIRKHAKATQARVKVAANENEVVLVIEDDGKGFNTDKLERNDPAKFGIRAIKERAESIHGRLNIESTPGQGTKVTLGIPLNISKPTAEQGGKIESTDS